MSQRSSPGCRTMNKIWIRISRRSNKRCMNNSIRKVQQHKVKQDHYMPDLESVTFVANFLYVSESKSVSLNYSVRNWFNLATRVSNTTAGKDGWLWHSIELKNTSMSTKRREIVILDTIFTIFVLSHLYYCLWQFYNMSFWYSFAMETIKHDFLLYCHRLNIFKLDSSVVQLKIGELLSKSLFNTNYFGWIVFDCSEQV